MIGKVGKDSVVHVCGICNKKTVREYSDLAPLLEYTRECYVITMPECGDCHSSEVLSLMETTSDPRSVMFFANLLRKKGEIK